MKRKDRYTGRRADKQDGQTHGRTDGGQTDNRRTDGKAERTGGPNERETEIQRDKQQARQTGRQERGKRRQRERLTLIHAESLTNRQMGKN